MVNVFHYHHHHLHTPIINCVQALAVFLTNCADRRFAPLLVLRLRLFCNLDTKLFVYFPFFCSYFNMYLYLLKAGLHKLCHPTIQDGSTWSKFGACGEHGYVFLFTSLGVLWFSENLIRYSLHVCLREVKNNLFSFKHSHLRHFSWRF